MAKKEKNANENPDTKEQVTEEEVKEKPKKKSDDKKQTQPEKSEAEKLGEQLAEANDKFLRLAAEYDNFRRRTQKEKDELYAMSKLSVISEFLPVIDNLDRALGNKSENLDDYKKGVEMISKQFYDTLKKLGAEEFGEAGDEFNPEIHNAVMHVEDENAGENVISAVFAKGYRLGEKVIRHAMVQVAN